MIRLTKDRVMQLYKLMVDETGGSVGVRDEGLLESAVDGVFQTFGGEELYPSKEEKGARLGFSLISNHAFLDGNKRIGVLAMLAFLEVNGVKVECSDEELVETGLSVASGKMDYESLLEWVRRRAT